MRSSHRPTAAFEWFVRVDGSIGAIFTPVTNNGGSTFENGCLVANFNPVAGTDPTTHLPNNPFTYNITNQGIIANITDTDANGFEGTSEVPGSGSCAYDPMSNTGVVQVRRLTLPPMVYPADCTQYGALGPHAQAAACPYNIYTLVDSGVLP